MKVLVNSKKRRSVAFSSDVLKKYTVVAAFRKYLQQNCETLQAAAGTLPDARTCCRATTLPPINTFTFAKVRARYARFELLSHYGPYYGGLQYMHVFYGGMALFYFTLSLVIGD